MMITPSAGVAGYRVVKTLGMVRGNTIRARHVGKDILAAFRNIVGGEVTEYTKMMAETREQALDRMKEDARKMGADAVLSIRFATSSIASGASEMLVYGTAVKFKS